MIIKETLRTTETKTTQITETKKKMMFEWITTSNISTYNSKTRNQSFLAILFFIRGRFTDADISLIVKLDLQRNVAWFIGDYFVHTVNLISTARKSFRPQTPNAETILADQTDYVWDPVWSHNLIVSIPNDISSAAISTVSVHKDFSRVTALTIDAAPFNYNTTINDKTSNTSLNSTSIITQETLIGTRNLTPQ